MTGLLIAASLFVPDLVAYKNNLNRESQRMTQAINRGMQETKDSIDRSLESIRRIEKMIEDSKKYDAKIAELRKKWEEDREKRKP